MSPGTLGTWRKTAEKFGSTFTSEQHDLSPLRILQTATWDPARFLGEEATAGTVAAGRNTDVVLLDADPTTAVANLHAVSGVVCRGQALSAADLAAAKEELKGRVG